MMSVLKLNIFEFVMYNVLIKQRNELVYMHKSFFLLLISLIKPRVKSILMYNFTYMFI